MNAFNASSGIKYFEASPPAMTCRMFDSRMSRSSGDRLCNRITGPLMSTSPPLAKVFSASRLSSAG